MSSDDRALLRDILLSAQRAIAYVAALDETQFETDFMRQDAILYRLGVIGEAARWLSDETCAAIDVDWPAVIGMRHRLIHGYRNIRLEIVWRTVADDLPALVSKLEHYLR